MAAQEALPDGMREAANDVWSIPHERAATKQTAGKAPAHAGFGRNAAHGGFCIRLLQSYPRRDEGCPAALCPKTMRQVR